VVNSDSKQENSHGIGVLPWLSAFYGTFRLPGNRRTPRRYNSNPTAGNKQAAEGKNSEDFYHLVCVLSPG
jgi:hypothetical protein